MSLADPSADPPTRAADLVLGPATRLLWRTPHAIHLEVGGRAVVVEGLPPAAVRRLVGGETEPVPAVLDTPSATALADLCGAGFLWRRMPPPGASAPHLPPPVDERRVPPQPRLAGELLSLAARHGEQAAELLAARRHRAVVVHGSGRAGPHLAALLAAAGVGRVHCIAPGPARLRDAVPGGLLPADEGRDLVVAADDAILRAAPEVDTVPLPVDEPPDLTVLVTDAPVDEARRATLHAAGAAHLVVSLGADHGSVGPLVVPGLTSCLRCADLHRRDRDPLWPALAAQLGVPPRHGPSSDIAVATMVVGAAAVQVLAFLDGDEPACLDGSLEIRLPDWRLRRRTRHVHDDCDCVRDPGGS